MGDIQTGNGGMLALIGGALLVPYALVKGTVATTIVDTGMHLPGVSTEATAKLFHVAEGVPLVLLAAGVYEIASRTGRTRTWIKSLGTLLAVGGLGMVLVFHVAEHTMQPGRGPLPADLVASLDWGYYVGWLVMLAGVALIGVAIRRSDALPRWVPRLLAALLPVGVGAGVAVVALDLYTYAGTQRLVVGLAGTAIGYRLWIGRPDREGRTAPASR